jgi:cysteine desulfurase
MDYHATTPVDPRVVDAMLPFFTAHFGNAASRNHSFGWEADEAVERARQQVADLVGARGREVVFTSGATESDNLAIKGTAEALRDRGDHIVTVATEHRAVLDSCRRLERDGWRVTRLPVDPEGLVSLDAFEAALTDRTILASVMAANNEIGVIQRLAEIVRLAHARGVLVHTDAAQAAGRIPFDVRTLGVDLVSLSAHKMCGPKGVGALIVRRRTPPLDLVPLIDGGGHERGLRSGTLNVPGIVGFGMAAAICRREQSDEAARVGALRDRLLQGLRRIDDIRVNGSLDRRLPHNLNVSLGGVDGEALLLSLGDIAVSSGAACSSATAEPSHVLAAIGLDADTARASIRFGLGRFTTAEEVDYVIEKVSSVVAGLRALSPRGD